MKGGRDLAYPDLVVRQYALRRITDVFGVAEASLTCHDRFGEELKAMPPTLFQPNAFDTIDDDIKWVSNRPLLRAMARGELVIHTVGEYCEHMLRCSQINAAKVADILGLPEAEG